MFIDKLAKGINLVDDTLIPDGGVAKNARLSKCFVYVSKVLGQIVENGKRSETRKK